MARIGRSYAAKARNGRIPTDQYLYHDTITIDVTKCGTTDHVGFPFLFSTTQARYASVANDGLVCSSSGFDIYFSTDPGGVNKIPHEMESYTATTGAIVAWVQLPTLFGTITATNTIIYINYGCTTVTNDRSTPQAVWDSNFKVVNHMNTATLDSTSTQLSFSATGAPGSVAGQDGNAKSFSGTTTYYSSSSNAALGITGDITLECWVKRGAIATYGAMLSKTNGSSVYDYDFYMTSGAGNNQLRFFSDAATFPTVISTGVIADTTTWHHVAYVRTGSTYIFYIDGSQDSTGSQSGSFNNNSFGLFIGSDATSGSTFNGSIDEVRISNSARSASYMKGTYNNQWSPSTFFSITATKITTYSDQIIIQASKCGSADSTNFPFMFQTTQSKYATIPNGGLVYHTLGDDIYFSSDVTGLVKLAHEISYYNPTTGQIQAWVKVPTVSHTVNTNLYINYGSPFLLRDNSTPTIVYDSNYKRVWHCSSSADSLGVNPLTAQGTAAFTGTGFSGITNGAFAFSGGGAGNNAINTTNVTDFDFGTGDFALSAWFKSPTTGAYQTILGRTNSTLFTWLYADQTTNNITLYLNGLVASSTANATDGSYHYIVAVRDSNTLKVYVDGVIGGTTVSGSTQSATQSGSPNMGIGMRSDNFGTMGSSTFLDEVRISNIARSQSWITTEYNNQSSPSTFFLFGGTFSFTFFQNLSGGFNG